MNNHFGIAPTCVFCEASPAFIRLNPYDEHICHECAFGNYNYECHLDGRVTLFGMNISWFRSELTAIAILS